MSQRHCRGVRKIAVAPSGARPLAALLIASASVLLLAGCRPAPVVQRAPTSTELAQVLGTVQTLDIRPPRGARSYALSQGMSGRLTDVLRRGRLPVTVALLQGGCPGQQYRLTVAVPGGAGGSCLNLSAGYGATSSLPSSAGPLPLNRWIPVYAFRPVIPGQEKGSQVSDENPAHWTVVSVYFSDREELRPQDLPDASAALEWLR